MKKNVASQVIGAQMISATDGSNFTGSVTVYVTGDGGTQAVGSVGSGACTHEGKGFHTYAPAQAETNFDHVAFTFEGTGAITATVQVYTSFPQTGDGFARLGAPVGASISADVAAVQADTDNIQTRIPAALVSGRMDSSVGAMAANVITATAINADAITDAKVAADVTIASVTGAVGSVTGAVGSVTGNVGGNVTGSVGSVVGLTAATVHADLDDIQARLPAALVSGRMDSSVGAMAANVLTATAINADAFTAAKFAADVTTELQAGLATAASLTTVEGKIDTIDGIVDAILVDTAEIGAAGAGLTALASAANLATVAGYLDTEIAAILADTNELQTDWANGGRLDNILDARASQTSVDDLPTNAELATALGTADDAVLAAIDDLPTNAELATALAAADDAVLAQVALVKAVTDKLDNTVENTSDGYIFTVNALQNAPSGGGGGPTAADIADAVWEEAVADHSGTSGSTAEALAAAGGAGDPWITALPGSYSAGQAGFIVGTNLNATVSSRATQTSVDDLPTNAELATALGTADDAVLLAIADLPTNAELATALGTADDAVLTAIGDLPTNAELATALASADDAVLSAIAALPTATQNADALLDRNMATGADSGSTTVRTPRQALRILRNKWVIDSGGEQTIYKEDDSTPSWTQQLATDAAATPVTGTDPAGP